MNHPPLELLPPDFSALRQGNAGVDYVQVLDSGRAGPTVLVQALTHGNEVCGAHALLWLHAQAFAPRCGRLMLVLANVAACARFDAQEPHRSRFVDEDLNRVWSDAALQSPPDSVERRRARELLPLVDAADFVLDIHSMYEACRPIMVCGQAQKNVDFARSLGMPADLLLDTGHPSGLRMVERGGFSDPASPKRALLIECGQHWARSSADVAIDTLVRFLLLTGLASDDWVQPRLRQALPQRQRLIRVSEAVVARSEEFRFLLPVHGLDVLPKAGTPLARDGEQLWCTPYDDTVLVMPSLQRATPGTTQVRLGRYVD